MLMIISEQYSDMVQREPSFKSECEAFEFYRQMQAVVALHAATTSMCIDEGAARHRFLNNRMWLAVEACQRRANEALRTTGVSR